MIIGIILLIGIPFAIWYYIQSARDMKAYRESQRRLDKRLADESIIEPETGAKLMLEQAEAGQWIYSGPVKQKYTEEEISNLDTPEEKEAYRTLNHIAASDLYKPSSLRNEDIDFINASRMFAKYNSWAYVSAFELTHRPGKLIIPTVCIRSQTAYQDDFEESQLLFWIYLEHDYGDYHITEKTTAQKLARLLSKSKGLVTKNYNVEVLRESPSLVRTLQLLKVFEDVKSLEIDLLEHNLLVKTTRAINPADLVKLEELIGNYNF